MQNYLRELFRKNEYMRTSTAHAPTPPHTHSTHTFAHIHSLFMAFFPPVLTWLGIYNSADNVIGSTSQIPQFTE